MSIAQNDTDPMVVEFQDGFIWPYFIITTSVLDRVGLSLSSAVSLNLYRPRMKLWTCISVGHVVHLSINDTRIFLKPSNVHFCNELQIHTSIMPFIYRMDVTAERAHMKSRMELQHLERAYASLTATPNSKRGLSPTLAEASPLPKRRAAERISVVSIVQPHSAAATRVNWRKNRNDSKRGMPMIDLSSDVEEDTDEDDPLSSPLQHHSRTPHSLSSLIQQPSATSLQPSVTSLQPSATSPLPSATALQASVTSLQPSATALQPSVTSLQPSVTFLRSLATSLQPLVTSPTPIIQTEPFENVPIAFGRAKAAWPGQRSVNDIVIGFTSVDKLSHQQGYTVSKAFEEVFDIKFPGTTFYEHRDRWNSACQDDRDAAQASNPPWLSFAETQPTSRAVVKAARRRRQRMLRRTVEDTPGSFPAEDELEFV